MQNTTKVTVSLFVYYQIRTMLQNEGARPTTSGFREKALTISADHARMQRKTATRIEETIIYGRLRPHRSLEESDTTPMIGCTIKPDSGGAIQTSDV